MLNFDRREPKPLWLPANTPRLLGILGKAGAGKDSVRSVLERNHGYIGYAFAEPMRAMMKSLFDVAGIDEKYMQSREFKETPIAELGVSYRQMMQTLGTEWGRDLKQNFWLDLAAIRLACNPAEKVCISDVRFKNEASKILEQGGVLLRVIRPGLASVNTHVSETEADDIEVDAVIRNDGTLRDLETEVARVLKELQCRT